MDYLNRAVRVEARTFETNRATLEYEEPPSLERPSKMRAVGDQSAPSRVEGTSKLGRTISKANQAAPFLKS